MSDTKEVETKVEDRGDDFTAVEDAPRARDENGRFVAITEKAVEAEPEEKEEKVEEAEIEEKKEVEEPEKKEEVEVVEKDDEPEKVEVEEAEPDKTVPYARFKEVIEQRKALQLQLEELKTATKEVKVEEKDAAKEMQERLDALYEKVEEARAEANTKEAARIQREIDALNREQTRVEAITTAKREVLVVQENKTYNQMLDYLETVRPVMDPNSEIFDERVVAELDFQVKAYEKMGMSGPDALRRASALIFEADPFAPVKQASKEEVKKKEEVKPAVRKVDVEKNLAAAKKTPAETDRSEKGEHKGIQPTKLSDEDFDKLPESKKRQLRGDEI